MEVRLGECVDCCNPCSNTDDRKLLDHRNFLVVSISLDGSSWWESLAEILLEVLLGHMRFCRCQAVEGWRIIFWDLVEKYLTKRPEEKQKGEFLAFSALGSRNASASLRSLMGMFFNSRPPNQRFMVRFPRFIVRMLMVMEEWQSRAWNLSIIKHPRISVCALITSGSSDVLRDSVQAAVESDTRMPVVQLRK